MEILRRRTEADLYDQWLSSLKAIGLIDSPKDLWEISLVQNEFTEWNNGGKLQTTEINLFFSFFNPNITQIAGI